MVVLYTLAIEIFMLVFMMRNSESVVLFLDATILIFLLNVGTLCWIRYNEQKANPYINSVIDLAWYVSERNDGTQIGAHFGFDHFIVYMIALVLMQISSMAFHI